jgi:hypothetical protein
MAGDLPVPRDDPVSLRRGLVRSFSIPGLQAASRKHENKEKHRRSIRFLSQESHPSGLPLFVLPYFRGFVIRFPFQDFGH